METNLEYNIRLYGKNGKVNCNRCLTSDLIGCRKWGLKCVSETLKYGDGSSCGDTGPAPPNK